MPLIDGRACANTPGIFFYFTSHSSKRRGPCEKNCTNTDRSLWLSVFCTNTDSHNCLGKLSKIPNTPSAYTFTHTHKTQHYLCWMLYDLIRLHLLGPPSELVLVASTHWLCMLACYLQLWTQMTAPCTTMVHCAAQQSQRAVGYDDSIAPHPGYVDVLAVTVHYVYYMSTPTNPPPTTSATSMRQTVAVM